MERRESAIRASWMVAFASMFLLQPLLQAQTMSSSQGYQETRETAATSIVRRVLLPRLMEFFPPVPFSMRLRSLSRGASDELVGVDDGSDDASSTLLEISKETGTARVVGETGHRLTDIAFTPSGKLFGITFDQLFLINSSTGDSSPVGDGLGLSGANALAADREGNLFGATQDGRLFRVDQATGKASVIGLLGTGLVSSGDIVCACDGTLFGTVRGATSDLLVSIDPSTGTATAIGSIGYTGVFGLAFGSDGILYGATEEGRLIAIDTKSGSGREVGLIGRGMWGLTSRNFPAVSIEQLDFDRLMSNATRYADWLDVRVVVNNPTQKQLRCKIKVTLIVNNEEREIGQSSYFIPPGSRPVWIPWQLPARVLEECRIRAEIVEVESGIDSDISNKSKTTDRFNIYFVAGGHNNKPWDIQGDAYSFSNPPLNWRDVEEMARTFLSSLGIVAPIGGRGLIGTRAIQVPAIVVLPIIAMFTSVASQHQGHCYGMAATSILYKLDEDKKPLKKETYDMRWEESGVQLKIKEYHMAQWASAIRAIFLESSRDLRTETDILRGRIKENNKPMILSIAGRGGHAVAGVGMIEFPDIRKVDIYLYDPNIPNNIQIAHVDLSNKTFHYQSDGIDFNKMSVHDPPPWTLLSASVEVINEVRAFLWEKYLQWSKGSRTIIIWFKTRNRSRQPYPVEMLFTGQDGKRLGYVAGTLVKEIPNGDVTEMSDGVVLLRLPVDLSGTLFVKTRDEGEVAVGSVTAKEVLGGGGELQPQMDVEEFAPTGLQRNGTVTINYGSGEERHLRVDLNGDGVVDQTLSPLPPQKFVRDTVQTSLPKGLCLISMPVQPIDAYPPVVLNAPPESVRLAKWIAPAQRYSFFAPNTSDRSAGSLVGGEGYWLRLDEQQEISIECLKVQREGGIQMSLTPGWNCVGAPYLNPVMWDPSAIRVRRGSQELTLLQAQTAGWIEDYAWGWQQDPSNPFTGRYVLVYDQNLIPNAVGQLEPWKGYWIYAYQDCELILPPPSQTWAQGTKSRQAKPQGVWSIKLLARAGDSTGEVTLGATRASRDIAIGLPPDPPTGGSPLRVVARKGELPLAVDVRAEGRANKPWEIEVHVPAGEHDTATLWWQDVHRAPRGVNPVLVDLQTGERKFLRTTSAHTFAVSRQGGVYKFRVELLPEGQLLRISQVRVSGGRSQGSYTVLFAVNAGAQVEVNVLSAGKVVRRLASTVTRSAGVQQVTWDGRDSNGVALPAGAYLVEIKAVSTDGQVVRATTPVVLTR